MDVVFNAAYTHPFDVSTCLSNPLCSGYLLSPDIRPCFWSPCNYPLTSFLENIPERKVLDKYVTVADQQAQRTGFGVCGYKCECRREQTCILMLETRREENEIVVDTPILRQREYTIFCKLSNHGRADFYSTYSTTSSKAGHLHKETRNLDRGITDRARK